MTLQPQPIQPVPATTVAVAKAAFPNGNMYLQLRDDLGTIYDDALFANLYPRDGQPALSPWQLALVTVLQSAEDLPDRQAADAMRSRIDWKYLLGLELTDPGFDYSVLCEFRARLISANATELLLDRLLQVLQASGMLKRLPLAQESKARFRKRWWHSTMRRSRYRGVAKTHVQHVATATGINIKRLVNWWNDVPLAKTKPSRFAALMTS